VNGPKLRRCQRRSFSQRSSPPFTKGGCHRALKHVDGLSILYREMEKVVRRARECGGDLPEPERTKLEVAARLFQMSHCELLELDGRLRG
jgi:hypothetical protein